jgi:NADPH:quinone reductase-like Zn-dependent oxidoreductase
VKAVRIHGYGDAGMFRVEETSVPQPGPNEVLIRLHAASINHFDVMLRDGRAAQFVPLEMPAILGGDGAGVVEAVGEGVTNFTVGDRVIADFASNGRGSYAEYGVAPITAVAHLPDNLSFATGVTLPKAGLTARGALDQLGIKAGDRVLVSGALGSVGRAAVQYLKEIGAVPVAGVRAERIEEAKALAGEVIDIGVAPTEPGFDFAISTATPASANALANIRSGGKVFAVARLPEGVNADNRVTVVSGRHRTDPVVLQAVADAAGRGDLVLPIAATFPLEQTADAHRLFAQGVRGKIVLRNVIDLTNPREE